jgi:hypothetical protein
MVEPEARILPVVAPNLAAEAVVLLLLEVITQPLAQGQEEMAALALLLLFLADRLLMPEAAVVGQDQIHLPLTQQPEQAVLVAVETVQ